MRTEKEMFELILKIANADERVRAVYMNGSRTNPDIEKDQYQDYDIVFVVTETGSFLENKNWLNAFGDLAILFEAHWDKVQFGLNDEPIDFSRRYLFLMLFKDGNRVDLVIEIKEEAIKNFAGNSLTVLLLDKDGFLPEISPPTDEDYYVTKPDENKYKACCNAFWWFLNDVAKGIARDQLPFAMEQFHSLVRFTLNQMTDWYIGMQTDFSVSTGKGGKYYKKYLPEELYKMYAKTYSDRAYDHFWDSVFSACAFFHLIAVQVADFLNVPYNQDEETGMVDYLNKVKDDCSR